jgi:outer membrane protein insertion porin family
MRSPSKSLTFVFPLAFTLGAASNLIFIDTSWGQPSRGAGVQRCRGDIQNPKSKIQNSKSKIPTIASIQVRFLDKNGKPTQGRTRPFIITREFDLRSGDVYNQKLAQQGLQRISDLDIVRRASIALKPTIDPNRVVMVVNVIERSSFTANLDTAAPSRLALQGPFQPQPVSPGADIDSGFSVGGSLQLRNLGGNDQNLALRVIGGDRVLNGELSFTEPWIAGDRLRTGYAVNVFNQRAVQSVFTGGDRDVNLPGGGDPWVHRLGGGVTFFRPIAPKLTAALGLSYQRVSVRDHMFSSRLERRDERNNPLTFSDSGQDDLLTLNFSAQLDRRNDQDNTTSGSRLLLGIDQSIPVGEANILFTRFSANYLQYIPVPLFGFTKGPRTLILNLQAGTMLGDVPGYEAFNLGAGLTRGFSGNAIGTGRSFVEATAEYHFPLSNFKLFQRQVDLGGELFVDYVSDLNSGDSVLGDPAVVRDKPGRGLGYGIGLRAKTSLGTARLEFAWSEQGDSQVIFTLGDRF